MAHTVRDKNKLLNRVRRIRGQVDAIERALAEEQDCSDLLRTIAACRGAINGLMGEVIEGQWLQKLQASDFQPSWLRVFAEADPEFIDHQPIPAGGVALHPVVEHHASALVIRIELLLPLLLIAEARRLLQDLLQGFGQRTREEGGLAVQAIQRAVFRSYPHYGPALVRPLCVGHSVEYRLCVG